MIHEISYLCKECHSGGHWTQSYRNFGLAWVGRPPDYDSFMSATISPPFVHESAYVDGGAVIGTGTRIWHFSHVADAVIGEGCSLGQNVFVAAGVSIGNNVKIQNNVSVYAGVVLEDDVFCGPSMVFTNVSTPRSAHPRNTSGDYLPTLVRRGASIGANATIVCGCTIGEYAFVAAGAVVTSDVSAHAIVMGVPARPSGYACVCGLRIDLRGERGACAGCERRFAFVAGELRVIDE
jgi:UDP-2-acetamido-3-amino-2,3-dideoxy-glucuronate N-acetyltransferase